MGRTRLDRRRLTTATAVADYYAVVDDRHRAGRVAEYRERGERDERERHRQPWGGIVGFDGG